MPDTRTHPDHRTRFRMPAGAVLDVPVATSFRRRAVGLMGREVRAGDALLFPRCGAIHTWFMRSPIDVVFLNDDDRVVRVVPALRPWRFTRCGAATRVLELPAGAASEHGLQPGAGLAVETPVPAAAGDAGGAQ